MTCPLWTDLIVLEVKFGKCLRDKMSKYSNDQRK